MDFLFGESVPDVSSPRVTTARRVLHAQRVVVCPGTELTGIAAPHAANRELKLTRLQMLRVMPQAGFRLHAAVMSDLSLVRYRGFAASPQAPALRQRLELEAAEQLANGIHLIAVQSQDGSLVVGDSHHDDTSARPFARAEVDEMILRELRCALHLDRLRVVERWVGVYPVSTSGDVLVESPDAVTRVVLVTSGTGASTAFALAEDVMDAW